MPQQQVIPLVASFTEQEELIWLASLQKALDANGDSADSKFLIVKHEDVSVNEKNKCSVIIAANPDPMHISEYGNLIWVQNLWAGVDSLLPVIQHSHVECARLIDPQLSVTMSETALLWSLYFYRDMHLYHTQQKERIWQQQLPKVAGGCTIGVLGLGVLGKACARRLKDNGFNVLGWSNTPKSLEGIKTYSGKTGLAKLLSETQILIVLLPLTDQTKGLLSVEMLSLLPKGAVVMNFARGAIIPEQDLVDCLDSKHLSHAVLDVFETEPLAQGSDLWCHPSITILPHISATTNPVTASRIAAQNLCQYLKHRVKPEFVDKSRGY